MSVSITAALIMCMGHLIFGVNSESDRIAAACDDGRVYVLNHQGKVTETCHVRSRPTSLTRSCKEMVVAAVGHSLVALPVAGN